MQPLHASQFFSLLSEVMTHKALVLSYITSDNDPKLCFDECRCMRLTHYYSSSHLFSACIHINMWRTLSVEVYGNLNIYICLIVGVLRTPHIISMIVNLCSDGNVTGLCFSSRIWTEEGSPIGSSDVDIDSMVF